MSVTESVPLYVREGSRFVVYSPSRQHTPPIPVPSPVEVETFTVEQRPDGRYAVEAPKCPHGSFARWAVRNCCRR